MSLDSLLPIAPARVRALVVPVGQIKRDRFTSFVKRLNEEHVVHLRNISADGRPNRNMFSPLGFPDGAIFYDLVTYVPPPSHLALSPFDLYREPLVVIAIADGEELEKVAFSKRQSTNGLAPTMAERNIRSLYQQLEELRDFHTKAITHQVLIFDYTPPADQKIPLPEGVKTIPPIEQSKRTTIKTIMCDISSLFLAEMTTLAKSFEAMTAIDSPGYSARSQLNGSSFTSDGGSHTPRRNSQFALPTLTRSASTGGVADKTQSRMSMPAAFKNLPFGSGTSTPTSTASNPVRSGLSQPPTTFDEIANGGSTGASSPEHSRPGTAEGFKSSSTDKVSVQGFGPGGINERWRNKGRGRVTIVMGSLYLQAGRWTDALKELVDGATVAKSINDHLWHGKALELIFTCLLLLGWAGIEFQVPTICYSGERSSNSISKSEDGDEDPNQPKWLRRLQLVLPELLERIIGLYSRISGEQLPALPLSETTIRFCNIMTILHIREGKVDQEFLNMVVSGTAPKKPLTTSPRLGITPSRAYVATLLTKAFPSSAPELLTTVDRSLILSGIATVMGTLGYHRKKAMVVRELVSVLINGLVEARTRGAADVGIHPAAGLVALDAVSGNGNGAGALELGEGDIEFGIDAFLGLLCKTYGVVGLSGTFRSQSGGAPTNDSDSTVIERIQDQTLARNFGIQSIKLNVLRACINFSEALPDFKGVLKYSSDLLRTAGSGVAPGPRREDAAPSITRDEQVRLINNISKTSELSRRLGLGRLAAEYWDEFLVRGILMDPVPTSRAPVPHAKSVLPGANTARTSQDVNPFIYNPFLRASDKTTVERTLVTGESATFRITLQNPYDVELDVERIQLDTEGAPFESAVESTVVGPYRTQILKVRGTPKAAGAVQIVGAIVQIRGCRERRFPIFPQPWVAETEVKVKGIGLSSVEKTKELPWPGPQLKPESMSLKAIGAQPVIVVMSTTLPQSSVMILEGEKQVFSVTLQNLSTETPADLLLFSFQDSTQGPLQTALANRDATPAELYEYELVLAKKPAFRLRKIDDSKRFIAAGGTNTFEFEILGKPGLTSGTIQIDYAHLGVPQDEIKEQFHTRQVCLDITVTVNASVDLARMDILPIQGGVPAPLWQRLGAERTGEGVTKDDDEHCLLLMDLRNAWPSNMQVRLETEHGFVLEEQILPGNTNRVIFPIPRIYLEDPHASIPALNPSRQRQFVVSSSKITPETERGNREAFWFREKILDSLKGTWKTLSGPQKEGVIELRGIRLTHRMIEAVKIDEVGIDISVVQPSPPVSSLAHFKSGGGPAIPSIFVDDFAQIKVVLTNRTSNPIYPTLRLLPALCHRPLNVALDFTRKFAWNGTLQQLLPLLEPRGRTEVVLGITALCRGEFELMASVEETRLWTAPEDKDEEKTEELHGRKGRPRSDTQTMLDALLGPRERRVWHSRHRCVVRVVDPEDADEEGESGSE
ncbi:hypercellular protein A [Xylariales sp. PMI_506]|nr:hypercellular protein A [Xylariales sp. PMI_506]